MDDVDPEPLSQKRAVAPAPRSVLWLITAEPGYVVATVIVDGDQPPARPEHPVCRLDAGPQRRPKNIPEADDDIGRIRRVHFDFGDVGDSRDVRAAVSQLAGASPVGMPHEDDVPTLERRDRIDCPRDLCLDVGDPRKVFLERAWERHGKVGHGRRV
jgi:hypothetical protein